MTHMFEASQFEIICYSSNRNLNHSELYMPGRELSACPSGHFRCRHGPIPEPGLRESRKTAGWPDPDRGVHTAYTEEQTTGVTFVDIALEAQEKIW